MKAITLWCSNSSTLALLLLSAITCMTISCGNPSGVRPPVFSGNTNVTVLLSATANDQLSQFGLSFNSITLTDKSGKIFDLISGPQSSEFIHLNGSVQPLVTVSIPEGVYSSATASVGYAYFTCVTLIPASGTPPGGLLIATYAYGKTPDSQVSLHLPSEITIAGKNAGLLLNMSTSESASLGSCYAPPGYPNPYSINPTFTVTPVMLSAEGQSGNGSVEDDLNGEISAVNADTNSFTITLPDGQSLSARADSATAFEGVAEFSTLTPGMFVNMDSAIQPDGSQLATRVAVTDTNTNNLSVSTGPVVQTDPFGPTGAGPVGLFFSPQQQGLLSSMREASQVMPYNFSSATFQISDALGNLQSLPFVPSFNASNMVPGQNVYLTTHAPNFSAYMPATTITLVPQTINGTVLTSSTSGSFSVYTVELAAYDFFPNLAVQAGQPTLLSDPSHIEVYVDGSVRRLNTTPLALGSTLRFRGLVFNDNGTLRMDCTQVNDGVNMSLQSNATSQSRSEKVTIASSTERIRSSVPITVRTFLKRP